MRNEAPMVWLRCRPETPALDGAEPVADRLSEIPVDQARLHEEVATDVVDTDARDIADVVSEVVATWGS